MGGALQACKGAVPHAPEPKRKGTAEETGKQTSSADCPRTEESLEEQAGTARGGFGKRFLGERKEKQNLVNENGFATGEAGG